MLEERIRDKIKKYEDLPLILSQSAWWTTPACLRASMPACLSPWLVLFRMCSIRGCARAQDRGITVCDPAIIAIGVYGTVPDR